MRTTITTGEWNGAQAKTTFKTSMGFQLFICFVNCYELHCIQSHRRRHVVVLNLTVSVMDLFHNDVKRGLQDNTRKLIGSAIMKVVFKPIKFHLTSRFPG